MRRFTTPTTRRGTRPTGAVELDWGHPLSVGLAAYVPLAGNTPAPSTKAVSQMLPMEMVSRSVPDTGMSISPTFSTTQNCWISTDLGVQWVDRRFTPMLWQGLAGGPWAQWTDALSRRAGLDQGNNTELTAIVYGVQGAVVGSDQGWWGKHQAGIGGGGWRLGKDSSSRYTFDIQDGSGTFSANATSALTVFEPVILVGRYRAKVLELWVHHINTAIDTGLGIANKATEYYVNNLSPVEITPTDTTAALTYGARTGAGNRVALGPAAMWKRYLSLSEIHEWIDNPWTFLTQATARRWFLPPPPPADPGGAVAAIVRRRKTWLPPTKPRQPDLQLDRQHRYTQNMVVCVPFFEGEGDPYDYARNRVLTKNGTPVWGAAQGTLGARTRAVGDFWDCGTEGVDLDIPTRQATILLIRQKTDVTTRNAFNCGIGNPTDTITTRCSVSTPFSSTGVLFDFGGATNNVSRVLWAGYRPTTDTEVFAFTAGPTGMRIYFNGRLMASHANAPPTRLVEGDTTYQIGASQGVLSGDLCHYQFFALINDEWPEGWVKDWSRDPWQLFKKGPAIRSTHLSLPSPLNPLPTLPNLASFGGRDRAPQPRPGDILDWRHPLTRGLKFHVTLNQRIAAISGANVLRADEAIRDAVTKVSFQVNGSVSNGYPSRTGNTLRVPGNSNITQAAGSGRFPPTILGWAAAEPMTFAAKFAGIFNAAGSNEIVSISHTLTADTALQLDGAGNIGIVFRDADRAVTTAGIYGDDQTFWIAFGRVRRVGAKIELFIYNENGLLVDYVLGEVLTAYPAYNLSMQVAWGTNANGLGAFSHSEWWGIWKAFLTPQEMAQLAQNPYQIYQEPIQR